MYECNSSFKAIPVGNIRIWKVNSWSHLDHMMRNVKLVIHAVADIQILDFILG